MYTEEIYPISRKQFETLIIERQPHCVSIYIPMDKKGKEQNQELAQNKLKGCIQDVKSALGRYQLKADEIDKYVEPVEQLVLNFDLWRNPAEGLALFLDAKNGLRYFKIPIAFEQKTYVANHFYLLPLLPIYQDSTLYYLLEISQDYIKFFEASRFHFKDKYLEDIVPKRLEEAVGFDFEQKNLQFRTGHATHGASFHGQGAGKEDKKDELLHYFRLIDKGVIELIPNKEAPLVLSCSKASYGLYQQASSYKNLFKHHLSGDPEFKKDSERHQESWQLVETYFEKGKNEKLIQFIENYHTQKTSYELESIVSAAFDGRVDTLFLKEKTEVFGTYDPNQRKVVTEQMRTPQNVSLENLVALEVFKQGGKVYVLSEDEMPVQETSMNSVFRY